MTLSLPLFSFTFVYSLWPQLGSGDLGFTCSSFSCVSRASSPYLTTSECTTTAFKIPPKLLAESPSVRSTKSIFVTARPKRRPSCYKTRKLKLRHERRLAWSLAFLRIAWLLRVAAGQRPPLSQDLGPGYADFLPLLPLYSSVSISTLPFFHCSALSVRAAPPNSISVPHNQPLHPLRCPSPPTSFESHSEASLWELPPHCAAKGSGVNGQANEFSPTADWCTQRA